MPVPSSFYDFGQLRVFDFPSKYILCFLRRGYERRRVSCAARAYFERKLCPCYNVCAFEYLGDREANAATEIKHVTASKFQQVVKCVDMCGCQVVHVDVVADTRSVYCGFRKGRTILLQKYILDLLYSILIREINLNSFRTLTYERSWRTWISKQIFYRSRAHFIFLVPVELSMDIWLLCRIVNKY